MLENMGYLLNFDAKMRAAKARKSLKVQADGGLSGGAVARECGGTAFIAGKSIPRITKDVSSGLPLSVSATGQ
jgi:hypothetical protein